MFTKRYAHLGTISLYFVSFTFNMLRITHAFPHTNIHTHTHTYTHIHTHTHTHTHINCSGIFKIPNIICIKLHLICYKGDKESFN